MTSSTLELIVVYQQLIFVLEATAENQQHSRRDRYHFLAIWMLTYSATGRL